MTEGGTASSRPVTLAPAIAVVVGNMVGTGVFTSLGYQLVDIQSGFVLIVLWALGGGCALCGAVCYGELAAAFPRSGGSITCFPGFIIQLWDFLLAGFR